MRHRWQIAVGVLAALALAPALADRAIAHERDSPLRVVATTDGLTVRVVARWTLSAGESRALLEQLGDAGPSAAAEFLGQRIADALRFEGALLTAAPPTAAMAAGGALVGTRSWAGRLGSGPFFAVAVDTGDARQLTAVVFDGVTAWAGRDQPARFALQPTAHCALLRSLRALAPTALVGAGPGVALVVEAAGQAVARETQGTRPTCVF